ncbi:THUMP domain-containing protein 2 isoform X2 [Desmodus rotundus]|uniref:THUMP domain-containing protein 2 isoform X2 n=1 Tax=Desmodus rotundus TaxID=9430 RepID=UPI0023815C38|nr:THUMP domain-containing protein 2 isoform X2 [Desmodus rotundus]
MAAGPGDPSSGPAAGARFFCTAGRGLEPFLMREVRVRLQATQVEYVSGKVFFTTCSDLNMLKKLKSAERLFLLIKRQFPFNVSSVNKGKIYNEMQRLVNDDPESWLNVISIWKDLLELDAKKKRLPQRDANLLKRKLGENDTIITKKLKAEQMQKTQENRECQLEKHVEEETLEQGGFLTNREKSQLDERQGEAAEAAGTPGQNGLTFRVSCRCRGALAKAFSAQEVGRIIGIALMKQFGWKADLRDPNVEIFIHLSDIYSVMGIPVFRAPLASRAYIRTAGLRSTVAWAMASVAEIKDACYVGADVSDSQLQGAQGNLKAAGLQDKIALLQVSVVELPLPSESVDVIISDIPFGKKFKLGKDIQSILREMERVLRAGGAVVLLLSEAHCKSLTGCESSIPLNSKGGHSGEPGSEKCLIPDGKTGTSETASPSLEANDQECLPQMPPFGSLVPVERYKVSLGKTDAFIYKYKKSYSSGLKQATHCEPRPSP